MLLCAPGAHACSATSACGMLLLGRLRLLLLLPVQPIPERGLYSSKLRGQLRAGGTPRSMQSDSHLWRSTRGKKRQVGETAINPANPGWSAIAWFTAILSLLIVVFVPPIAAGQDPEEIKGAPAEPTDAQEIRERIAAV